MMLYYKFDILNGHRTSRARMTGCPVFSEDELRTVFRFETGQSPNKDKELYEQWLEKTVAVGWADILQPSINTVSILIAYGRDDDANQMLWDMHKDGTLQKEIVNLNNTNAKTEESPKRSLTPMLDEGYLG